MESSTRQELHQSETVSNSHLFFHDIMCLPYSCPRADSWYIKISCDGQHNWTWSVSRLWRWTINPILILNITHLLTTQTNHKKRLPLSLSLIFVNESHSILSSSCQYAWKYLTCWKVKWLRCVSPSSASLQVCIASWQLQSNMIDIPLHFDTSVFNPDVMRVIHVYRQHDHVPTTSVRSSSDSWLSVNGILHNILHVGFHNFASVEEDVFFRTTLVCQDDLQ